MLNACNPRQVKNSKYSATSRLFSGCRVQKTEAAIGWLHILGYLEFTPFCLTRLRLAPIIGLFCSPLAPCRRYALDGRGSSDSLHVMSVSSSGCRAIGSEGRDLHLRPDDFSNDPEGVPNTA